LAGRSRAATAKRPLGPTLLPNRRAAARLGCGVKPPAQFFRLLL